MNTILPVPVLAEPEGIRTKDASSREGRLFGEARESTENCDRTGEGSSMADSRGGQNFFCPVCEERKRKNRERVKRYRQRKKT